MQNKLLEKINKVLVMSPEDGKDAAVTDLKKDMSNWASRYRTNNKVRNGDSPLATTVHCPMGQNMPHGRMAMICPQVHGREQSVPCICRHKLFCSLATADADLLFTRMQVGGRPSFTNLYSAVNALAGHWNSFGADAPVPKKRIGRIEQVQTA